MKRWGAAVGGAVVAAACVAGLLSVGPLGSTGDGGGTGGSGGAGGAASPVGQRASPAPRGQDPLTVARRAVGTAPEDPAAWSRLAHAELERARTTLDTGRLDKAEKALRRSLELQRADNYQAVTGMGQLANARHEFTEGRTWALRSTRMAPDRSDGYGVLADAEIQLGHYRAARRAVQRMLDLEPSTAAYSRAAYDLEIHGRTRDAGISLRRAADSAQTPDETAFAESRRGELAWSQGESERAERHFKRAVAAVPGHPYSVAGLARLHAARGHTQKALRLYDRVTGRAPLPQFLVEAAELQLARTRGRTPDELAVLEAQMRMLRAHGGPVDPHLALYEADHEDPGIAVELMRREWKRSRSVVVADALGWALHRAGRDAEALPYARAAGRTGSQNALFHYHRGVIEHLLGRDAAGDRHLRRALELNPHFSPYHAPRAARLLGETVGPSREEESDRT